MVCVYMHLCAVDRQAIAKDSKNKSAELAAALEQAARAQTSSHSSSLSRHRQQQQQQHQSSSSDVDMADGTDGAHDGDASDAEALKLLRSNSLTDVPQMADSYNPLLQGCRSVEHYERIKYISEGAYGMVFAAKNKVTGEVVAIKQVRA